MKSIFSISVTKKISNTLKEDIKMSIVGSPQMKKEIQRVLQMANRRAQNIEKSGVISPAYQSLVLEGREGYSKFSITGRDITNKTQWQSAKYEYAKAIEFLNNPTSMTTGAKQYIKHIAKKYDVPQEVASNVIRLSTSTEFKNDKIPLLNYRSMVDEYLTDSKDVGQEMEQNAQQHAQNLENQVNQATNEVYEQYKEIEEQIIDDLNDIFRIK